jgi:hypothetical protein
MKLRSLLGLTAGVLKNLAGACKRACLFLGARDMASPIPRFERRPETFEILREAIRRGASQDHISPAVRNFSSARE